MLSWWSSVQPVRKITTNFGTIWIFTHNDNSLSMRAKDSKIQFIETGKLKKQHLYTYQLWKALWLSYLHWLRIFRSILILCFKSSWCERPQSVFEFLHPNTFHCKCCRWDCPGIQKPRFRITPVNVLIAGAGAASRRSRFRTCPQRRIRSEFFTVKK